MTDSGAIVLWGLPIDPPIAAVRDALEQEGYAALLLDQQTVLDTEMELTVGSTVSGELRMKGRTVDLDAVRALYVRPYDATLLLSVNRAGENSEPWRRALELHDMLFSWAELTPALVLNRPSAMASNNSKPYQALRIQSLGFRSPETLVTTDPQAAVDFWKKHEQVIYKSVSGVRSIVRRLAAEHLSRFDDVTFCPTQFQQYIPGTEYRVHVVGEEIFACRVHSDADDYRYSPVDVEFEACELPKDVADRSKKLAGALHLTLAGLDLRHSTDGVWYCFEVNPSPAFTSYERRTGQPIAQAVARLLASNCHE